MSRHNWKFLSYSLSSALSGYGDGKRISIRKLKSQAKGDSSNNSEISLPSHFGTHLDFPLHFNLRGKSIDNYNAEDFVFKSVKIIDLQNIKFSSYLISVENLKALELTENQETDFLFFKTGYCEIRDTEKYWRYGLGFDIGTAEFIKLKFPNLKAIGFDLISLSSYQERKTGRKAHFEFLIENDLLIIEDVDLRGVSTKTKIKQLIVAPIRFENADGTPVTILANIEND